MKKNATKLPKVYVDTSVMVAAHTREPQTELAQAWLTSQGKGQLIISMWMLVECESALAIKLRRKELDAAGQVETAAEIDAFARQFAPLAIPTEADFLRARDLCGHAQSRLRAGDALHLAIASRLGATSFATLDEVLSTNAAAHGMTVAI